jgi:acyl carrier protein
MHEVETKIRGILKRNLIILGLTGVSVESIKNEDRFIDDVGIDSVGIMGLVSDIEKEFNIKIEEGELTVENFSTLGKTAAYVQSKLSTGDVKNG